MTKYQVMQKLKAAGSARTRKILRRHEVPGDSHGEPCADQTRLTRDIGTDQGLAEALWATGHFDARCLATTIADRSAMTSKKLDEWVQELDR